MEPMTAADFASAVHSAVSGVRHLSRELSRLNLALVEALEAEPDPLARLLSTGKGGGKAGVLLRDWYGQLFRAELDEDDDEDIADEELDEGDDQEEAEDEAVKAGARIVTLDPDQPLLGVKLAVYDGVRGAEFQPQVLYAVLKDWGIGPTGQKLDGPLQVKRYMLKRLPKAIDAEAEGKRFVSAAKVVGKGGKRMERRLSFKVAGEVRSKPLFDLSGPESVSSLAAEMKDYWMRQVAAGRPAS